MFSSTLLICREKNGMFEGDLGVENPCRTGTPKVETSPSLAGSRLLAEGPPAASQLQGWGALVGQEHSCPGFNCWISTQLSGFPMQRILQGM